MEPKPKSGFSQPIPGEYSAARPSTGRWLGKTRPDELLEILGGPARTRLHVASSLRGRSAWRASCLGHFSSPRRRRQRPERVPAPTEEAHRPSDRRPPFDRPPKTRAAQRWQGQLLASTATRPTSQPDRTGFSPGHPKSPVAGDRSASNACLRADTGGSVGSTHRQSDSNRNAWVGCKGLPRASVTPDLSGLRCRWKHVCQTAAPRPERQF